MIGSERGGRLEGDVLHLEEMQALPVFQGCSPAHLRDVVGSVVLRHYAPGQILCREGEPGATAFYLVEGEVGLCLTTPVGHLENRHRPAGAFGAITNFSQSLQRRDAASRSIPVDAPVDLSPENLEATLEAGELFGEMTCLSLHPRSATVRARTGVVALEMLRDVLLLLKREGRGFQEQIEQRYEQRLLATHLRDGPLGAGLSDATLDDLRARVQLVSYEPGQCICRQGDDADRLFLVRIGFVRVARPGPSGEVVLRYLHRGDLFGATALLGTGRHEATHTALDRVELVEIARKDVGPIVREAPAAEPADTLPESALMQASSLLLIDLDRCTRCDDCVRACAASHEGVTRLIRDGLRREGYLVPTSCRACHDPLCMVGCPVGAVRREDSLEIVIEDWCIGCALCVTNCPYGNLNVHGIDGEATQDGRRAEAPCKAIRCDLCAGLGEPPCVYACPHEAAVRADPRAIFAETPPC
ncbi:MAG: cyclic nucleotide-binding domain-containing protein [Planctomycetota bacterium]